MPSSQRTVLITGAGRGIGYASALAFADAGWRVLSLDKQFGNSSIGERLDFDLQQLEAIPRLIESCGSIDTLVNNAAVLYCDPVQSIPDDHRREILTVNLVAPSALIAALAPQMQRRGSGRISM